MMAFVSSIFMRMELPVELISKEDQESKICVQDDVWLDFVPLMIFSALIPIHLIVISLFVFLKPVYVKALAIPMQVLFVMMEISAHSQIFVTELEIAQELLSSAKSTTIILVPYLFVIVVPVLAKIKTWEELFLAMRMMTLVQ
jgi:hypothetical protein